eukprot:SAG22_NODE_1257_length_4983_cov_2.902968_4_plen_105_part_00
MALLRARVGEEIEEAIKNTEMARRYSAGVALDASVNVPKDLPHWVDGTKMVKLAKFARDRVIKGMKGQHAEFNKENVKQMRCVFCPSGTPTLDTSSPCALPSKW